MDFIQNKKANKLKRLFELDFNKGVFITLMVLFHLSSFTSIHGKLTEFVYSFHMPGFLIISGYLFNTNKDGKQFLLTVRNIIIPYIIFEIVYIIGISLLGSILQSSNRVELSWDIFCNKLFIEPMGTYWYLHTLTFCLITCFFTRNLKKGKIITPACILFILSLFIQGLLWENILYFIIGYHIRQNIGNIKESIIPSFTSIVPIILMRSSIN